MQQKIADEITHFPFDSVKVYAIPPFHQLPSFSLFLCVEYYFDLFFSTAPTRRPISRIAAEDNSLDRTLVGFWWGTHRSSAGPTGQSLLPKIARWFVSKIVTSKLFVMCLSVDLKLSSLFTPKSGVRILKPQNNPWIFRIFRNFSDFFVFFPDFFGCEDFMNKKRI